MGENWSSSINSPAEQIPLEKNMKKPSTQKKKSHTPREKVKS